jgi:hypothetical protein
MDRQLRQADSLETLSEVVVDSVATTAHLRTLHGEKVFSLLSFSLSLSRMHIFVVFNVVGDLFCFVLFLFLFFLFFVLFLFLFFFSVKFLFVCNRGGRFFYVLCVWSSLLNSSQLTAFSCFR